MFRTFRDNVSLRLVIVSAALFLAAPLQAQQAEAPVVPTPEAVTVPAAPVTPAATAPAPQPSPLFQANATEATPTIAAAQTAHEESMRRGRHSFTMSTLTLILVIVLLVLLID